MHQSPRSSSSSSSSSSDYNQYQNKKQLSPKKQEWALINQYKALEYEKIKQKQRILAQQKKNNFKRELDNQLQTKNNVQKQQIEADRRYYEFITRQANELKQREERQKMERIIKRRQAEEQNARLLEMSKNSRIKDHDTGYHLDIGKKSQQQRKKNSQNIKKTVLDSLDQQIRLKNYEKQRTLMTERQNQMKNLQYQYQFFDKRNDPQKNFRQNDRVYQYYQQLERQKKMKDMELEYRFVDEAAFRKRIMEEERIKNQQMRKSKIKSEIKQTLDQQVKAHNYKKLEQSKINPQQYSYGVIGNVFRERQSSYDKARYMEELRMQAEQQKKKKKMENYMSEEQYKFNLNQLNKVVNGQYAHNGYLDRSLGTIGDNRQLRLNDIKDRIHDNDAEAVKHRIESLRKSQNYSQLIPKTDRSF